jgi:hypothetical protein
MYKLYSPDNEMDLAFLRSLLEADGIAYFVHNDHFGSLSVGPKIGLFNAKTIFVRDEDATRAKEVIAGYLEEQNKVEVIEERSRSAYTLKDRIRVILEMLLFWWFIPPGKRWRNRQGTKEE